MSSSSHSIRLSDVTVVVAAKNEGKNIQACIESIIRSASPSTEIIVINDGSTDDTASILEGFGERIRVLKTSGIGPAAARNLAIHSTKRSYVAFADGDCVVHQDWLHALTSSLQHQSMNFISIGGAQHSFPNANFWDRWHAHFLEALGFVSDYVHTSDGQLEVKHNPTCNVLYLRKELIDENGFDEKLWPCEDLDLDIRLVKKGKRMLYTPNAKIFHHRPDSMLGFFKMMRRYGFGHGQIIKKHGPCQKIHALPVLFLAFVALAAWCPVLALKILAVGTGLLCVLLIIRSKSLLLGIFYGFYVLPMVLFWNVGFFHGLLASRRITKK